jgi:hypothetical protein
VHVGLLLFALPLLAGSLLAGMLLGLGCTEGDTPDGTAWAEVCDRYRAWDSFAWWVAVLAPVVVLFGTQLVGWFRRHVLVATGVVAALTAGYWTTLLLIVSGNLLAD